MDCGRLTLIYMPYGCHFFWLFVIEWVRGTSYLLCLLKDEEPSFADSSL